MNNADDSRSDEEQLAALPTDCRALLAMTRPLVIVENTPLSSREEKSSASGCGISPEPGDRRAEFTLRKGEILCPDNSEPATTKDGGPATRNEEVGTSSAPEAEDATTEARSDLPQTDSNLQIRIYLGMS